MLLDVQLKFTKEADILTLNSLPLHERIEFSIEQLTLKALFTKCNGISYKIRAPSIFKYAAS